jgi:hypothetical protein
MDQVMNRPPLRRLGTTLVELMVFAGIGMIVISAAWSFFQSSMKRGVSTDKKLEGVQTALLFSIQFERDLRALYEGERRVPIPVVKTGGAELTFYRYTDLRNDSDWSSLEVVPVTYHFLVKTGKVLRQVGEGKPRTLPGDFERVNFRLAEAKPPVSGETLPEAPAIIYSVITTSREVLQRPTEKRKGSDRTVLVGGVSREQRSRREFYPFWNPVPYGRGVVERQ